MKLHGINAIEQYVKRHYTTIMQWYRKEFFPMVRIGGAWESDTEKIDAWHKARIEGDVNDRIEAALSGTESPEIETRHGKRGRKPARR